MIRKYLFIYLIALPLLIAGHAQVCYGLSYHDKTLYHTITVGQSITLYYYNISRAESFSATPVGAGSECIKVSFGKSGQTGWCTIKAVEKTANVPFVTVSYCYTNAKGEVTDIYNFYNNIKIVDLEAVSIPGTLTMQIGDTYTFSPVLTPSDANTTYNWYSSDETVVKMENGTITALKQGSATITCITHNGKSAECKVSVKPILATEIAIYPQELDMLPGEQYQLRATFIPENTSSQKLTWESSNQEIAIVSSNGLVIALAPGTTIITANTTDGSNIYANCILKVKEIEARSITVTPHSTQGIVGETIQLSATITPQETSNQAIAWSSSNPQIVSVSDNGLAYLFKEGRATITAKTLDGTNLSDSCHIEVTALSNLKDITNTNPQIFIINGNIQIKNINKTEKIRIYNILGQIIYEGSSQNIPAIHKKGIYLIDTGKSITKIQL